MSTPIRLLIASAFIALTGCGCFESWEDRNLVRYGGGGRDPNQPEWHRCLFGTTWLPGPQRLHYLQDPESKSITQSEAC